MKGLLCESCEYEKISEDDEICDFCLDRPIDKNTGKPVNWKEKGEDDYGRS